MSKLSKYSYGTNLAIDHDLGMHTDFPHPACPICERHRVNGTCVVDSHDLYRAATEVNTAAGHAKEWLGTEDIREAIDNTRNELDRLVGALNDARATIANLRVAADMSDAMREAIECEVYQDTLSSLEADIVAALDARSDATECMDTARRECDHTEKQNDTYENLVSQAQQAIMAL